MRSFTVAVFMALLACGALAATPLITLDFASTFTSGYTTVAPYTGGGTSGSGLWLEGTETVAANPHDLHELWTSFTAPETGGKMLIVNGAVVGGKEVWSKNFSLAAGSYDFSFMAASSYPVSPASLRLFVNDVAVGSLLDLTDTAGAWQTFTESFTASGSTTKLSLVDTNTASDGNDFVLASAAIATPEPATFLLTGSALLGLAALIRKFRGKV